VKTGTILGFIAVAFLVSSILASQASAQQYQSGNRQFQGTRTPVNGTYTNSAFGVTVTIPDGWSGFEMKRTSGTTSVMLAPGGFHMQQGQRSPIMVMVSMYPRNSTTPSPQLLPRNMAQNETCNNDSNTTKTINGMSLDDIIIDCSGPVITKTEYDVAKTDSSYVILGYRANSTSNFDSQLAAFDSMLGTLQIANAAGAPAVPEFPISFVGLAVAIMIGTVVILGRSKIMPSRI
jgi:hypothetical protein